ncbi:MAG: ABC transporter permease subunit [Candidatus Poribacteria bacterium]|nr:ABC transporter permease subunit [Candidatus Poribacteria bacterium]
MWHIAKREIYDNLNSLRFALTTVLLLALMVTNAVRHLREHPKHVQRYREAVAESLNHLTTRAEESLYTLAQYGPGNLYKKPSPLHFCANGSEPILPDMVEVNKPVVFGTIGTSDSYEEKVVLHGIWTLSYPDANLQNKDVGPDVSQVDWGFIIGYVLSLLALLFTFDTISGERERGTLRLMLANSIPRHTVLIGKFLGALLSVSIPFILAVLVNLLLISTANTVHLTADAWARLGIIFCLALLYTSLFLALGLLVSTRVQRSAVSLMILLLTWVTFVVFMPSTLASIASSFSPAVSFDEFWQQRNPAQEDLWDKYGGRLWSEESDEETLRAKSGFYIDHVEKSERWQGERLKYRSSQVHRARAITSISPATLLQHLIEAFAGTGFDRHLQFVENTQRYARQFREFIVDTDRGDPESLHIIGVREGMSQKSVSPAAVPRFADTLSLSKDLNARAIEILLLVLFVVVLLSGAYLAFVRVEV